jgi:microcystin-dependent protein
MEYTMDMYLSQIIYLPFSWDTTQTMPCRGQILDIHHYQALYSLLGTRWGGDGQNTFALPDLRPWTDAGPDYGHRTRREWHSDELVAHMVMNGVYPSHG